MDGTGMKSPNKALKSFVTLFRTRTHGFAAGRLPRRYAQKGMNLVRTAS